jgi:hypothetical protein
MDAISFAVGVQSKDLRGRQLKDLIYRSTTDDGTGVQRPSPVARRGGGGLEGPCPFCCAACSPNSPGSSMCGRGAQRVRDAGVRVRRRGDQVHAGDQEGRRGRVPHRRQGLQVGGLLGAPQVARRAHAGAHRLPPCPCLPPHLPPSLPPPPSHHLAPSTSLPSLAGAHGLPRLPGPPTASSPEPPSESTSSGRPTRLLRSASTASPPSSSLALPPHRWPRPDLGAHPKPHPTPPHHPHRATWRSWPPSRPPT